MEIHENLFETLIRIPHLQLDIKFDLEKMIDELNNIDEYVPYNSSNADSHQKYKESFFGRALYNQTGNSLDGMTEEYSSNPIIPTELAEKMPTIVDAAKLLGATTSRLRIMMVKAGKSLDWHRHHRQPKHILTVHVPLIMPDDFLFQVCARSNYKNKPVNPKLVYSTKYPVGVPTVFNSFHLHNVFNNDQTDRISVMMYANLNTPVFASMVIDAIESYNGPLVPTNYERDSK